MVFNPKEELKKTEDLAKKWEAKVTPEVTWLEQHWVWVLAGLLVVGFLFLYLST